MSLSMHLEIVLYAAVHPEPHAVVGNKHEVGFFTLFTVPKGLEQSSSEHSCVGGVFATAMPHLS